MKSFLQKLSLVSILAGASLAQQPVPRPREQQEVYKVNALGSRYTYTTKEQADLATKVLDVATTLQEKQGTKPYVWGGDGFEPLEVQKRVYGKQVTDTQPAGSWRTGQPTVPGVDCSGLTFQIQKAMRFDYGRLTARGYAEKSECILPAATETKPIKETALPGDLLFFTRDNKNIVHTATYLGNGFALECAGTRVNPKSIPKKELEVWRAYANPKKNKKTDADYGGMQVLQVEDITKRYTTVALHRWIELMSQEEKDKRQEKKKKDKKR